MLIHPEIDPIALQIGPFKVYWYGLMYFFAFLSFIYLGKKQLKKRWWNDINEKMLDDVLFYGAIGVVLGGRLITFLILMKFLLFGKAVCPFMEDF